MNVTRNERVVVIGVSGQLGNELARELSASLTVLAPDRRELDLLNPASIRGYIRRERPTLIINAAAYTAVDRAESEPDLCAAVNTVAPGIIAEECAIRGAAFVHFSTDYVFDGKAAVPYRETDAMAPLNVYGRTKAAGERLVLGACDNALVFRTSWIYDIRGRNFALTMLRLAHEREELMVVNDQIGAPTSASAVASAVAEIVRDLTSQNDWPDVFGSVAGVYHMSAAGSTTWYEFALRILDDDPWRDSQTLRDVRPVPTHDYPTEARRPQYSVLDNTKLQEQFGVTLPSWDEQWKDVAAQLRLMSRPISFEVEQAQLVDHV